VAPTPTARSMAPIRGRMDGSRRTAAGSGNGMLAAKTEDRSEGESGNGWETQERKVSSGGRRVDRAGFAEIARANEQDADPTDEHPTITPAGPSDSRRRSPPHQGPTVARPRCSGERLSRQVSVALGAGGWSSPSTRADSQQHDTSARPGGLPRARSTTCRRWPPAGSPRVPDPFSVERVAATRAAKVVVLMPPPCTPGLARCKTSGHHQQAFPASDIAGRRERARGVERTVRWSTPTGRSPPEFSLPPRQRSQAALAGSHCSVKSRPRAPKTTSPEGPARTGGCCAKLRMRFNLERFNQGRW